MARFLALGGYALAMPKSLLAMLGTLALCAFTPAQSPAPAAPAPAPAPAPTVPPPPPILDAPPTRPAKVPLPGSSVPAGTVRVRLQLNWVPEPEFGGFFAAAQDGLYLAEGLDVQIIRGASGTPTPQLTASGQVEFGVVSGDQILSFAERGASLVGVFAVFHTSPMGIMVKKDAPWKSLEELWKSDATVAIEVGLPFVKYLNAKFGTTQPGTGKPAAARSRSCPPARASRRSSAARCRRSSASSAQSPCRWK
jgi:NitT/TauT family transport system substrate-binding protein